ncbi:LysM peptidoglycan-binding domain-containing protein [Bizionia sp. KMM 8389]
MKKIFYIFSLLLLLGFNATIYAQNYKTHKVQAGETIETIAQNYQVTSDDIYALNPDAQKGIKRNTVLIIPNKASNPSAPQATIEKEITGFKNHRVKRKETLYSLSKTYNVSQDEIKKHNTFLYANNLRKGDVVKIPEYKRVLSISEPKADSKSYTVLPKEGKWRVAYKFGITVAELEALNPDMNAVLQAGEVIQVPNIDNTEEKPVDNEYSYYEVLPKEGYYRLKIKLGLEQSQLEALNPELKVDGLKEGMILKVPHNDAVEQENTTLESTNLTTRINKEEKHVVFMLPFKTHKINIDSVADTKDQMLKDPFLSMSLDFYSGVTVALDSLKNLGVNLKVDVYDTKNRTSDINDILKNNDFNDVNAVVGPFMPNNIKQVSQALKINNTPIISPLAKKIEVSDNVFQSRPSGALLKDKIVNYLKTDTLASQVLIIADHSHTAISNELKGHFPNASQVFSRKDKKDKEKDAFYIYDTDIISKLKPGRNIVFLETSSPGFVSNVTSKLNSLISKDRQIILVSTDMGSAFEDDEVSNYHLSNLQFTFAAIAKTYNIDDENSFASAYEERYGVTPNKVAVRGFDITMDVVLRLVNYSDLYESVIQAPLTEYVENKFAYKKKFMGGFYNDTVYLVKYEDLKIVEVN